MPTLKEAKDKVRDLSKKALVLVEDPAIDLGEKKTQLDKIETDIKEWTDQVTTLTRFEEQKKTWKDLAGAADVDPDPETKAAAADPETGKAWRVKSLGQQLVEHALYKQALTGGIFKKQSFTTGEIELKTAVTENVPAASGSAYALVQTPPVLPGVLQQLFQPLTISALIPEGTIDGPILRYLVELAVTNAAATVAELGLAPESAITFAKVDEAVKKIATFLPVSEEMLEDVAYIISYIDSRLRLFIQLQEETQLLRGDGTGNNLVGLLNRSGLAATITKGSGVSTGDTNDMDPVYRQITAIRTTSFLEPDAISIDPTAWQTIALSKDSQNRYLAASPFMDTLTPMLWGKPVTITTAMPSATALVGAFRQACQKFRRQGLTVETSNSHADFFQRGETAFRASERLGLAVYRPGAFGIVNGL